MGKTADELTELKQEDDKLAEEVFQQANCTTWFFRCRAKMDTFQDQQRYVKDFCKEFTVDADVFFLKGEISSLGG